MKKLWLKIQNSLKCGIKAYVLISLSQVNITRLLLLNLFTFVNNSTFVIIIKCLTCNS